MLKSVRSQNKFSLKNFSYTQIQPLNTIKIYLNSIFYVKFYK